MRSSARSDKRIRRVDGRPVADPCWVAENFWSRLIGLMGRSRLTPGSGMLIKPCSSIHTFFMRFAIDVVYLDQDLKILKIKRGMAPWRLDFPVARAVAVLELPVDGAAGLSEGEILCLS